MNLLIIALLSLNLGLINCFSQCEIDFQQAALKAHNKLRRLHKAPPLKSDMRLQTTAQNYAYNIALTDRFQHSTSDNTLGENLANSWDSTINDLNNCASYGEKFVQTWYDEISQYDFRQPGFNSATGHFTQVVWVASSQLGCGIAMSETNTVYGVCNYTPQGNFDTGNDDYEKNVLPTSSSRSS